MSPTLPAHHLRCPVMAWSTEGVQQVRRNGCCRRSRRRRSKLQRGCCHSCQRPSRPNLPQLLRLHQPHGHRPRLSQLRSHANAERQLLQCDLAEHRPSQACRKHRRLRLRHGRDCNSSMPPPPIGGPLAALHRQAVVGCRHRPLGQRQRLRWTMAALERQRANVKRSTGSAVLMVSTHQWHSQHHLRWWHRRQHPCQWQWKCQCLWNAR